MTEIIHYRHPDGTVQGWLAYDGDRSPLAAGGCRMQPGLDAARLAELAGRMTLKQKVLGLNVDGAKCGIDYDPRSAGGAEALRGFIGFLRDELRERFSMGPDMGTDWSALQRHALAAGVPSPKYAIRRAQGLTHEEFLARMLRLDSVVGLQRLSSRRAGHALAHAVIAAALATGTTRRVRCALQGFGNLGRAAAYTLYEEGVRVIAVADEYGCVVDRTGLDIPRMLADPAATPVPLLHTPGVRLPAAAVLDLDVDVLVLAACENAVDEGVWTDPHFGAVTVGANCGLSAQAEDELHHRGVFVVPDFIGGIGGSASMEALFGPREVPTAEQVLASLARLMNELVGDIRATSRRAGTTPRQAALDLAARGATDPDAPPYGCCPYLTTNA